MSFKMGFWDWDDRGSYVSETRGAGMIGFHMFPALTGLG